MVVHPGERVRYLITIVDQAPSHSCLAVGPCGPSPTPLNWSAWPTYHEELEGVVGAFGSYRLNCARAAAIPVGGQETFEMFIAVPAAAKPGPAMLRWTMDSTAFQPAGAYVWVEACGKTPCSG
jgi:hypothetical protein